MTYSENSRKPGGSDGLLVEDQVSVEYEDRSADRLSSGTGGSDSGSGGPCNCATLMADSKVEAILLEDRGTF